jgi:putative ABC transport system permease protein
MSMFRVLNLRYLRRQPLRSFLAMLSIAGAVGGVVAGLILVESLDRSIESGVKAISLDAPLRVAGPLTRAGVHPSAVRRIEQTRGVKQAVPVVTAVAVAQRMGGDAVYMVAIGVDCRIEAVIGAFGCDAQTMNVRTDGPALTSKALVRLAGEDADIRTDRGRVPIKGAVFNDTLDRANGGRVAIFDLRTAQRLFDRGKNYDAVFVVPERGVSEATLRTRLAATVGPTYFVLGPGEPAPWMTNRGPLIPLLGLGLLIALGLSVLLVYNIVSLSLADRRRDLAVASAIGTSPRRLLFGILAEAAVLGTAGGAIGFAGGINAARPLITTFATIISTQATGLRVDMYVPASALVAALLIGALVGAISAIVPARRALRLDLAGELHGRAALTDETPPRAARRVLLLLLGGTVTMGLSTLSVRNGALEAWQPPLGAFCLLTSAIFIFSAVGALAPLVISATMRFGRDRGGPLRVAMANLITHPRRTSVIATAVGAAVGLACVLGALIPATRTTILRSELVSAGSDVGVATLPLNNASNVDARPSPDLVRRLADVPGVARVSRAFQQEITDRYGVYSVRSFENVDRWSFEPILGETGSVPLERGEAVVGTSIARSRHLRPGSTLRIATPRGFVPVRVAGIWVSSYDNGYTISISPQRFVELFGEPTAPNGLTADAAPGVSASELARRVEAADIDPDVTVRTSAESADALADEIADQASPFWTLQRVLLLVALVGTLSTLLLVGVQRRRELGILGAVGFAPGALGRMTLTEALAAGVAGCALGALGSLPVFEALRNGSAVSIGVRTAYVVNPLSAVTASLLALVVVAAGAALPAWRAGRVQIVEAIRDE